MSIDLKPCSTCGAQFPAYQKSSMCVPCRKEADHNLVYCEKCGHLVNKVIHSCAELLTGKSA